MKIGCDVGGVVRAMVGGAPVEGAIEGLRTLQNRGHTIVFISKCKQRMRAEITLWLAEQKLTDIPIVFCEEDSQKRAIADAQGIGAMVDDKLSILSSLPMGVRKVWLCSEEKKVIGARKHQAGVLIQHNVVVADKWNTVVDVLA